jgi:lactoylglutathione lyase
MATKKTSKAKKPAAKAKSPKRVAKPAAKKAAKKSAAKTASAKKDGGLRLRSASPSFTVNDIDKSLAWYRDVLGFTAGDRWEMDGVLRGVELSAGDVLFMIGQDDWQKGRDRVKGVGVRLYCETDQDIDKIAARIKAAGGTLAQEPADQSWGYREISLDDPDGYKLTIGKALKKKR